MRVPNGFIEVTALVDGRKALIRSECVIAVLDNGEEDVSYGVKPQHRTILFGGETLDVTETLDEICGRLYASEL